MKLTHLVVPLACLAALACNRDRAGTDRSSQTGARPGETTERPGETTITGAAVVNNDAAMGRIVAARCDREATCNNIGADKRFGTRDVCSREMMTKMHDDLKASDCPKGIDGKHLEECLTAIRKESCNNPLEALSRITACNTPQLCLSGGDQPTTR